jgi:hypothetical protein
MYALTCIHIMNTMLNMVSDYLACSRSGWGIIEKDLADEFKQRAKALNSGCKVRSLLVYACMLIHTNAR